MPTADVSGDERLVVEDPAEAERNLDIKPWRRHALRWECPVSAPTAVSLQPLTFEEYLREGTVQARYDILDGVRVFTMPSPTLTHQEIAANLLELLRAYGRSSGRGRAVIAPFDVVISREPLRTRQPGLLFISKDRLEQAGGIHLATPLTVAPELVVEILSESDTRRRRIEKVADYRSIGVQECWLVSPEAETVEVLRLTPQGAATISTLSVNETLRSDTLPGFEAALAALFDI